MHTYDKKLVQISDARKIYHQTIDGEPWSAIQITTAAAVCTLLDLFRLGRLSATGFVRQEDVEFEEFIANRFGQEFHHQGTTHFCRDVALVPGEIHE